MIRGLAERYVELGLRVGRHHADLVDSYYGPPAWQQRIAAEPLIEIARLRDDCRRCIADLDAGADDEIVGQRRRWIRSQLVGLETTIRSIGGEAIPYEDEVRDSYGVIARRVDEADLAEAHRWLDDALAGTGPLRERVVAFRDRHAIPADRLRPLIDSLSEDFRERTATLFGLPEGERVRFELVTDRPWSGFNYYEGELSSLVAINTDLPVLSSSIGHLIAHEAYPGHHTEATRKEAGMVRARGQVEESIKMIGTPSCAISEGLADLGIEVLLGGERLAVVGEHARSLGVTYDTEAITALGHFGEMSSKARGNVALMIHADGASLEDAAAYAERWLLLDPARAAKAVEFMTDPTWRAYGFCYSEGLELCRGFVGGDPARFERLITEQLTPPDLVRRLMRLRMDRAAAFLRGGADGVTDLAGVIELDAALSADGSRLDWSIGNSSATAVAVRSVGWIVPLDTTGAVRMFANGYQSWSPTGVVTLGVDRDPSRSEDAFDLYCAAMHADQRPTLGDELRSEQVCALADDGRLVVVAGWLGGATHDGTFRLRTGDQGPELVVEAHLGGAVLAGGARRELHPVSIAATERGGVPAALDAWAVAVGTAERARIAAPYQVGWCSWYHYFSEITQDSLLSNLALADDWPFDVFQLDDGFQPNIGDWLRTNGKFGGGIEEMAAAISAAGRRPGLWIAPFLAHPDSDVHRAHPEWIARMPDGSSELPGGINEIWNGIVNVLDTSHPEVIEHLEGVAGSLVDAGYTYLKLDFTYAPSFDGVYHDPSMTPAERVRAGYDAIRRGAGNDAFILGCGAPLGSVVGVVDGNRIGPDVAPRWEVGTEEWAPSGYREQLPSTRNAWQSTLARSFMHRRLWLNDPDCLMLRTDETELSADAAHAWARAIAASGGMALVSDDLALLGPDAHALLDEVIRIGRAVDEVAALGRPPVCDDLLEHRPPRRLSSGVTTLDGDPDAGTAHLTPRP